MQSIFVSICLAANTPMNSVDRGIKVESDCNMELLRIKTCCTALLNAARAGKQSCVETLLQAGADPNPPNYKGLSPLHFATLNKQIEIMMLLVNTANCDRHATDNEQRTALHMAASSGALEEMQYLVLDACLDRNARDNKGYTPRDEARLAGQHLAEWWLKKTPRSDLAADIPQLEIMRRCWEQNEVHFKEMVKEITAGNFLNLSVNIPNTVYGHQQDATGRTLLHWAAALGMTKAVKALLEECRVYAHVMTWAGETPCDLALQAGHHQLVIWSGLHQLSLRVVEQQLVQRTQIMQGALHAEYQQFMFLAGQYQLNKDVQLVNVKNSFSDVDSQEQQYYILLFVISQCDDVRWAVDLLEKGSPLEPVGGLAISALCSAVTSNRPRIVSLLVAAGAPLSTTSHGLNLLTLAWCSPDVTPRLQAIITSVFLNVLQHEHETIKDLPDLDRGVHHLISTIKGEKPWLARSPRNESVMSLTKLMVQAARANCTLTCSFLYLAGAQASLCSKTSVSPLHAALETKHWKLAGQMVKTMRGCLYVADSTGRLPTTLLPSDNRQSLEMVSDAHGCTFQQK
ncbi:ankyrin repeat and death domain-containing protein 1B-like [Procambarus clarkii]|uniref:ankyrin repeat and death domain-containing protein 1B-like n=1 Tax=Procambarus clarkii TaxID=6728 RepID=UPI003743F69E